MKQVALSFLLIACCFASVGQSSSDSLRDLRIKQYPDHFALWPLLKRRTLTFEVAQRDQRNNKIEYAPNNAVALGAGAYLFDLAFEFAIAVPINDKSYALFGKSKARDIQLNALSKRWGADIYYQKYQGFYADDPAIDRPKDIPYPQRNDIVTRNFGVTGSYIFSDDKFSFKSAYNFAERQLKSGGSIVLTGTLNSFRLRADSAVLAFSYRNQYGVGAGFEELRYTTLSIAPGYAYNVAFRHFFLNAALMVGPAHNWISYRSENQPEKHDIKFNSFSLFRIGFGYNADRFFTGINFSAQSRVVTFGNLHFSNSSNTFRLLVGYRFRETRFLKPSVWDIPRKLLPEWFY
jgi:hypothetical protein